MAQVETKEEAPVVAPVVVNTPKQTKVYPILNSEIVWIHRKDNKSPLPESGVLSETARDWQLMIGPSFATANSGVLLGRTILTPQEEQKYMPALVGVLPTHMEWDNLLNAYWNNLLIKVPYEGLKLEVGMKETSDGVFEPIVVFDYVLYKYCLLYPQVANDVKLMHNSSRIRFYLLKDKHVQEESLKLQDLKDLATVKRFEIKDDMETVKSIIILSGNSVAGTVQELNLTLAKLADNDPAKFIALAKDKRLLEKAFIERLVRAGIMTRPLNSTLVLYDGAQIAKNLEDAVAWLNAPQNSEALLVVRDKLSKLEM